MEPTRVPHGFHRSRGREVDPARRERSAHAGHGDGRAAHLLDVLDLDVAVAETQKRGAVDLVLGQDPLDQLLAWLTSLAPRGIIEFVPKNDPTVQRMLALRDDVFPDYDVSTFATLLGDRAKIVRRDVVSAAGRELFWYSAD